VAKQDDKKDMLEAMQAGADDYLGKPFDQLELKARLLVGKPKPTGAYMRRSKMAGIVWRLQRCSLRTQPRRRSLGKMGIFREEYENQQRDKEQGN
jgi:DNA-binding response OmpR family regulator